MAAAVALVQNLRAHPRALKALQLLLLVAVVAACVWAVRSEWSKAGDRIENADLGWLAVSVALVAVYYLVFILGWIRMLAAWGINITYRVALEAEMVSMLAKYLPGGVWTPAARTVALRKSAGVTDTPTVLASILVEAGLSAVSGVIVFVSSLAWVHGVDAPVPLLVAFGVLCAILLHPRIFQPVSAKILKPFGASVEALPFGVTLLLLVFYCMTWLIGGLALYFLLRSVHADPGLNTVAFLGGTAAVGAIVAVLAVFSPSGLGVREASMYGLLLAVTSKGPALGAALMNRLTITLVEIALFAVGVVAWRSVRSGSRGTAADRP
jgi:uncharacterized membrane protein YbhN (UPF0104 family)